MDGWNTSLSYWDPAYFQGRHVVSFREGIYFIWRCEDLSERDFRKGIHDFQLPGGFFFWDILRGVYTLRYHLLEQIDDRVGHIVLNPISRSQDLNLVVRQLGDEIIFTHLERNRTHIIMSSYYNVRCCIAHVFRMTWLLIKSFEESSPRSKT